MYRNGHITEDQWKSRRATPLGTIRYGSNEKFQQQGGYFMEEVRRELIKQFGEQAKDGPNSLYAGGLWVRSSMDPETQDAAAQALRDGLVKFDGGRGWRDLGKTIDISKDWAGQLDRAPVGTGYADWQKRWCFRKATGRRRSASRTARPEPAGLGRGDAGARGWRRGVRALKPGMVIIVKQTGPGNWQLKSVPEVSGGMVAEEVHTGRVMAMQGGFDVIGSSYNRATQAFRQPARRSSRSSM